MAEIRGMRRMILAADVSEYVEFRVLPDDPGYPGQLIMGSFLGDKLVGKKAMHKPPPDVEDQIRLKGRSKITDVRPIFLVAMEMEAGGQIAGSLLMPAGPYQFSELPAGQLTPDKLPPMSELGHIVRLQEDRQFPSDFLAECTSIFDKVLEGGAVPKIERIIHHLEKEPIHPVGPMRCMHDRPWRECRQCNRTLS